MVAINYARAHPLIFQSKVMNVFTTPIKQGKERPTVKISEKFTEIQSDIAALAKF